MPRCAVRLLPLVLAVLASTASAQTTVVTHIGYVFPSISRESLDSASGLRNRVAASGVAAQITVGTRQITPVSTDVGVRAASKVVVESLLPAPMSNATRAMRFDDDHRGCRRRRYLARAATESRF
jgi:hypothetical protein